MKRRLHLTIMIAMAIVLLGGLLVWAQEKGRSQESERKVKEAEVPPAALAALKKLAGSATITEFAEEIEHGSTFYEGSWKGRDGNVDGLVTAAGDVVEIEEAIPAEKVPATARAGFQKEAGKDSAIKFEKKTLFVYEAHFKRDGKGRELILTPDGRRYHEGDEDKAEESEAGEDEDE